MRKQVPSALYQKVRIPVDPADVIADGTIALTMTTESPPPAGASCYPVGGVASMRKIELDYRGAEIAPTSLADFFPASSSGITVVIPEDADADMITAGLTAVAALAYRYDDDTPVDLALSAPAAATATASQRVVALVDGPGRRGDHRRLHHVRHPDADLHRRRRRPGQRGPHPVHRHPRPVRLGRGEPLARDQAAQHRQDPHPR